MKWNVLVFLLAFCWLPAGAGAKGYFEISPHIKSAYRAATSLRFQEARAVLAQLNRSEPDNLMAVLMENYLDFFTVFASGSTSDFKKLSKNMDKRLSRIARGDRNSPYFLYAQAEIRLQWAILRGQFGEYLSAASDIKQAYALLDINAQRYPDFIANKKSLGIMHALAGNVPAEYQWALRALGGMRGNMAQGLGEMAAVMDYAKQHEFLFENETVATYAFIQLYLNNQPQKAWNALKGSKLDAKENPLAAQVLALVGMRTGHNDEAIECLKNAPAGPQFQAMPQRSYLLGLAKLRRLDKDAEGPLQQFLQTFGGNTGKREAYQKLAWCRWLQGDAAGYRQYMDALKKTPKSSGEGDVAALREAESAQPPDLALLKARLLFDGAYYQQAYDVLKNASAAYRNNIEYSYRLGRIAHQMNKPEEAQKLYAQTIEKGQNDPRYFACNAALQLGLLYESQAAKGPAREAFNRCLALSPKEYAASLHAQAKAGLDRVK